MRVHGSRHPELKPVYELVEQINAELIAHMNIEERVLFPYIKALALVGQGGRLTEELPFTAESPILKMEAEHETVGKAMESIRKLTNDYSLPEDACASYSLLYRMLDEFEEDLHLHVHLENNILFPKTLELEKRLSL